MTDSEHKPGHKEGSLFFSNIYLVYIGLTVALFGLLVFLGWLAYTNEWIPSRGIG